MADDGREIVSDRIAPELGDVICVGGDRALCAVYESDERVYVFADGAVRAVTLDAFAGGASVSAVDLPERYEDPPELIPILDRGCRPKRGRQATAPPPTSLRYDMFEIESESSQDPQIIAEDDSRGLMREIRAIRDMWGYRLRDPKETTARAISQLDAPPHRVIRFAGAEHFALWCKTGISSPSDVERLMARALRPRGLVR